MRFGQFYRVFISTEIKTKSWKRFINLYLCEYILCSTVYTYSYWQLIKNENLFQKLCELKWLSDKKTKVMGDLNAGAQ